MKDDKDALIVWCEGMDESLIGEKTVILPVRVLTQATDETCTRYKNVVVDDNGDKVSKEKLVKALNALAKFVKQ